MSDKLMRIRQKMQAAGIDAFVTSKDVNRRWLSGFTGSAGTVVVGLNTAHILVDFRYVEQAKQQAVGFEVLQYQDYYPVLAELMQKLQARQVGFESHHVVHKTWERLRRELPNCVWVPTENWVEQERGVKDQAELASLKQAAAIADQAFSQLLSVIKPGVTEKQLALELEFIMRRAGAERLAFETIVASGARGALPHAAPTDKVIERGELVTLDFGAVWQGYHSDMTRTVAVGAADAKQKEIYHLVLQAQLAGVAAVAPGKTGRDIDAVARQLISDAGYGANFGHGLGHGVGLEIHEEFPRLSMSGEVILQPNMVCSVEPGVYIPGWGGVRIEDLVVVTADGCRVLCTSPKELLVV